MLTFVDESKKSSLVSIGFYVSKSYIAAFEALMREYKNILKQFLANVPEEIKFSTVLNIIGKTLGVLPGIELVRIFRKAIRVVSLYGYGFAIMMNNEIPSLPKIIEDISYIKKSIKKVRRLMKSPRYNPSKNVLKILNAFLFLLRLYPETKIIVVDHNFIQKRDLMFLSSAIKILGYNVRTKFCSGEEERGILLADFIAGISKHIVPQYKYGVIDNIVTISINNFVNL